jgi:lipid-A-disaccharide synthase
MDLLLLLFRFEEEPLREAGVSVRWVGHPAGALHPDPRARAEARAAFGAGDDETLLAFLPGSRRGEVERLLPPMLEAGALLAAQLPGGARVVVSDAGPVEPLLRRVPALAEAWRRAAPVHHRGPAEALLRAADAAAVASGTATLEAAAIGAPLVITYRTGALNYALARRLVRVPHIGLPNLVLGEGAAEELIQRRATGHAIAAALARLLGDAGAREAQRRAFARLPDLLGGAGSAARAAVALVEFAGEGATPAAAAAREGA